MTSTPGFVCELSSPYHGQPKSDNVNTSSILQHDCLSRELDVGAASIADIGLVKTISLSISTNDYVICPL